MAHHENRSSWKQREHWVTSSPKHRGEAIKPRELAVAFWHWIAAQYLFAVSVPLKSVANVELIGLGTWKGTQIALGCLGKPNRSVAAWGLFSFKCTTLLFLPKYWISFDFQGHQPAFARSNLLFRFKPLWETTASVQHWANSLSSNRLLCCKES